jgi:cation diffusion facilitator family transporter
MRILHAQNEKSRVALTSIGAAILLTTLKLVVGLKTNSLGILSEAAHSGLDLLAAAMTYVAVTIAERPPDKDHLYGHGKIENVSAFLETLLLVITCAWIIWEAVSRLISKTAHVEANVWSFIVIVLAIVIDFSRSRALGRVARKYRSQALEADALHFASDVWSSLVVIAGLVFVSLGSPLVDAMAALIVAVLVLFVSYRLGRRTIDALMDRVPEGLYEEILKLVRQADGVAEVRAIRLRSSGAKIFVDTTVAIPRTMLFQQVHDVMDTIEKNINSRHPDIDVVVHAEPYEGKDESVAEQIRMITLGKGLGAPHHLEVHKGNNRYQVEFDLEFSKGKNFVEAHDLTTEVEEEIKSKVPEIENVTIHMEEYHPEESAIGEVTGREHRLRTEVAKMIGTEKRILEISDLNLLKIGDRYNLSVNCRFDRSRTLGEIHGIICEVEKKLYDRFKVLRRVTIHAEPN